MSEERKTITIAMPTGFGAALFWAFAALLLLTGNCNCGGCGPSHDYVKQWMDRSP